MRSINHPTRPTHETILPREPRLITAPTYINPHLSPRDPAVRPLRNGSGDKEATSSPGRRRDAPAHAQEIFGDGLFPTNARGGVEATTTTTNAQGVSANVNGGGFAATTSMSFAGSPNAYNINLATDPRAGSPPPGDVLRGAVSSPSLSPGRFISHPNHLTVSLGAAGTVPGTVGAGMVGAGMVGTGTVGTGTVAGTVGRASTGGGGGSAGGGGGVVDASGPGSGEGGLGAAGQQVPHPGGGASDREREGAASPTLSEPGRAAGSGEGGNNIHRSLSGALGMGASVFGGAVHVHADSP